VQTCALPIYGHTERGPDFIHPAIALSDRVLLLVEHFHARPELARDLLGDFRHPVALDEREDPHLDGSQTRMERKVDTLLSVLLVFAVGVDQTGEQGAVASRGGFDDPRHILLARRLVEVLELLARVLLMPGEIEVAAIVNPFQLVPSE